MTNKKQDLIEKIVTIPDTYQLVTESEEVRNKHVVTILRYQKDGKFVYNGPRIIAVFQNDDLLSIKNLTSVPEGKLPGAERARELAESVFSKSNRSYARGLSFIRIEHQQRDFIDDDGKTHQFPVLWIKFAHRNGSYNWVTLGANGTVVEMEVDSRWDYFRGRRKTEMWDNDDWVLAHEGKGPQLHSPNALA
ncbi:hypothetical protein JZO70_17190 [Enterococcus sp. 669A]|uniref:Uncharacterized protein n=1 Tax=Candidatus Enterococcus moelleringii TaxID=2815325 RepID=A0ABS3LE51_9ENTE|nr:hypothetical protein [Enterococcus sp. 669A]MBO1307913.1 hypothetical protein [Enterococcus sp. 669A]